jgi:SAM-dependent methyltransferase
MREATGAITVTMTELGLEIGDLRQAISKEYEDVANNPVRGFHFHTGRPLTKILGYKEEWLEGIPESAIESFAGTGNPFSIGEIRPGERVIDIGCGAGIDSLIAAKKVGADGRVIGIDMTKAMLDKARQAGEEAGLSEVEFRYGHAENLPVRDGWADVVISNGVINLTPDKEVTFREIVRVLKPDGRIQIGDILVQKQVPDSAKRKIGLWTG